MSRHAAHGKPTTRWLAASTASTGPGQSINATCSYKTWHLMSLQPFPSALGALMIHVITHACMPSHAVHGARPGQARPIQDSADNSAAKSTAHTALNGPVTGHACGGAGSHMSTPLRKKCLAASLRHSPPMRIGARQATVPPSMHSQQLAASTGPAPALPSLRGRLRWMGATVCACSAPQRHV